MAGSATGADLLVLAFAVALGTDRYQLSGTDDEQQRQVLAAVSSVVQDWT